MDGAALPLQLTLWSKVGLHPLAYCALLREPLGSAEAHGIELYNPLMAANRTGRLSLAPHNIHSFALLKHERG